MFITNSPALCWTNYVQIKLINNKAKLYGATKPSMVVLIFLIPQIRKTGTERMYELSQGQRAGKWEDRD